MSRCTPVPKTRDCWREAMLVALWGIAVSVFALAPHRACAQFVDFSVFAEGGPEVYMPNTIESARAAGIGRVTSVLNDGAVATWWNPGSLAFAKPLCLSLSTAEPPVVTERIDGYIRSATVSGPLPIGARKLGVGLGFKRYAIEGEGFAPFGGEPFRDEQDAYVLALGYRVFPSFSVGASAEYVRIDLADETFDAASVSFGAAFRRPIAFEPAEGSDESTAGGSRLVMTPLAGASLLHIGQDFDFEAGGAEKLARQLRGGIGLGVALEPPPDTQPFDRRRLSQLDLMTALEVYFPAVEAEQISQERAIVHMGAEIVLFSMVSGRIGFTDVDRRGGLAPRLRDETFGFGLSLPPGLPVTLRLDWASVPAVFDERADRWSLELGLAQRNPEP